MNPIIKEALRYLSNAKEILEEKAIRENGIYLDQKYIKMAGHTAYSGVLYALDKLVTTQSKSKRKSVEFYREFLGKYDKKMLTNFNDIYTILHLGLGSDGVADAVIIKRGMAMTKEFIDKIAARLN